MIPSEQRFEVELLCNEEIAPAIDSILQTGNLKKIRVSSLYVENVELKEGRKFLDELLGIAKKDIEVTIIIGQKPSKGHWRRFFEELYEHGIKLYYNYRVHSKMILLYGEKTNLAFIGSSNFTHGGLALRYEASVFLKGLDDEKFYKLENHFNKVIGAEDTRVLKDVV
jgi:phosphatidylserine/phosphatidylglycerophosphate/cardiolipin synthase-like enzyme